MAPTPFRIDVPQSTVDDLRDRLVRTRWPEPDPVGDWSQGVPLRRLRELCRYWADGYDWRATERRLNAIPQFRTEIDGLPIHEGVVLRRTARISSSSSTGSSLTRCGP